MALEYTLEPRIRAARFTKLAILLLKPQPSLMCEKIACLPCRTSGALVVPEPRKDGIQQIHQGHIVLCPHKGAQMIHPFIPIKLVSLLMSGSSDWNLQTDEHALGLQSDCNIF